MSDFILKSRTPNPLTEFFSQLLKGRLIGCEVSSIKKLAVPNARIAQSVKLKAREPFPFLSQNPHG
jgi:hypothetical protein